MSARKVIEFSRRIRVQELPDEGVEMEIAAAAEEREALARRLGLLAIDRLSVSLSLTADGKGLVHLRGAAVAEIVQTCVVTLQPVPGHLALDLDRYFAPELADRKTARSVVDVEGDDPPDPIVDGTIDLGEVVAEQLAIEMDPFPRAPGADFTGYRCGPEASPGDDTPFAVLRKLWKGRRSGA
jgi:uncharacterized metal-binding protein YceD (DUF177 family)